MILFTEEYVGILNEIAETNPEVADAVQEALPRVQMMLQAEDRGWLDHYATDVNRDTPVETLEFAKEVSELSREMCYGSPLIDRGLDLRQSYVWSKGIVIEGAPDITKPAQRGPKSQKDKFFKDPAIRRYILSAEAHKDMESAAFNDGTYFFLGDDTTKTGHPVPISEIDGVYTNPDYSGEVWAYRRTYTSHTASGEKRKSEWIYVDTYTGNRTNPEGKDATLSSGEPVAVNKEKTLFVKSFNTMVGDAVGIPDSLPSLKWARIYAEMVNDGRIVSKANAKFTYKVKNATATGAQNTAAKISNAKGVGNAASMGKDQDLIGIPQSNRSYDFNGLRPIASMVATALSVSVVHILSDPGAAGSSYGSASNLDLPTKRAMVSRQQEWVEFLEKILKWGTGEDLVVKFASLDDPDPYREMQLATMAWNTGLVHEEETRPRILEIGGFTSKESEAPEGVMLPNNEDSLPRSDIDTDGVDSGGGGDSKTPETSVSPDQGKRNGTGGVSDSTAKDLRNEQLHDKVDMLAEQISMLAKFVESNN